MSTSTVLNADEDVIEVNGGAVVYEILATKAISSP